MASLRSWRAGCVSVAFGALLTCMAVSSGSAQDGDKVQGTPPAASHSETKPPAQDHGSESSAPAQTETPAAAPAPGCKLRENQKLELIV